MIEYIVRSGNGYVCEDRGLEMPLMTSDPKDALPHSFYEAHLRLQYMQKRHGLACEVIALPVKELT